MVPTYRFTKSDATTFSLATEEKTHKPLIAAVNTGLTKPQHKYPTILILAQPKTLDLKLVTFQKSQPTLVSSCYRCYL